MQLNVEWKCGINLRDVVIDIHTTDYYFNRYCCPRVTCDANVFDNVQVTLCERGLCA